MKPKASVKPNDQMSLRQSGQNDHKLGLKAKLTGWGKICKLREGKPFTRKARAKD